MKKILIISLCAIVTSLFGAKDYVLTDGTNLFTYGGGTNNTQSNLATVISSSLGNPITNNQSGVTLQGAFTGDGSGLTNLPAGGGSGFTNTIGANAYTNIGVNLQAGSNIAVRAGAGGTNFIDSLASGGGWTPADTNYSDNAANHTNKYFFPIGGTWWDYTNNTSFNTNSSAYNALDISTATNADGTVKVPVGTKWITYLARTKHTITGGSLYLYADAGGTNLCEIVETQVANINTMSAGAMPITSDRKIYYLLSKTAWPIVALRITGAYK